MKHSFSKILVIGFLLITTISLLFAYVSISKYPGKTINSSHFNIITDYWCDLYKVNTPTGKTNEGMIFAKLATVISAVGFGCFWIAIPQHFVKSLSKRLPIQIAGLLAMILGASIFTGFHNVVIIAGSITGIIAIGLLLINLKNQGETLLFNSGLLAIIIIIACNLILYMPVVDSMLPILQKISFLIVITWTFMLSFKVLKA